MTRFFTRLLPVVIVAGLLWLVYDHFWWFVWTAVFVVVMIVGFLVYQRTRNKAKKEAANRRHDREAHQEDAHDDHGHGSGKGILARALPFIFVVVAIVVGYDVYLHVEEYKRIDDQNARQASIELQKAASNEAERQQHVCGTKGEPLCECQGPATVMRYLEPGFTAEIHAVPNMKFGPKVGSGYKLCDTDSRGEDGDYTVCTEDPDQNLAVGLTVTAVSTSDYTVALKCQVN